MKLYTEEQVKDMLFGHGNFEDITPIELPSDEEIYEEAYKEESNIKDYAFTRGAKWMRDKIQGGKNEQQ